jgi:NTP pyrophosphatase (non-canonical NTP hydrolase)
MPELKQNPTLKDFQDYVTQLEKERGFTDQTVLQRSLLLGEEVGELFKAIRKAEKMGVDQKSMIGSVDEELADVLIFVCSIANRFGIDLEKAFREKEEINKKRTWK